MNNLFIFNKKSVLPECICGLWGRITCWIVSQLNNAICEVLYITTGLIGGSIPYYLFWKVLSSVVNGWPRYHTAPKCYLL